MPRKKSNGLSVSVIIPAYNAEEKLSACLDALLEQSVLPDEIIVVDDGSTDQTKKVAEAYSLVTVLTQKNQGPARARNAGAEKAKSTIIVFVDSDCIPEKNWLEEMLKPFEDSNVAGVQGAYRSRQKSLTARFDQADIEYRYEHMQRAKKLYWIATYSAAYRRTIFLAEGKFDESFPRASGEDAELSYLLAENGHQLVFSPRAIVYHTHPDSPLKYLRVKLFRAYWRNRMYMKHTHRVIDDSYTPNAVKISFFVGALFFLLLAILIVQPFVLPPGQSLIRAEIQNVLFFTGFCIAFISVTFWPLILKMFQRDWVLALFGVFLIFFRSLAFVVGAGLGLFDQRVRA